MIAQDFLRTVDADAALISDIVTSQTDYMLSQVRIIEVKP